MNNKHMGYASSVVRSFPFTTFAFCPRVFTHAVFLAQWPHTHALCSSICLCLVRRFVAYKVEPGRGPFRSSLVPVMLSGRRSNLGILFAASRPRRGQTRQVEYTAVEDCTQKQFSLEANDVEGRCHCMSGNDQDRVMRPLLLLWSTMRRTLVFMPVLNSRSSLYEAAFFSSPRGCEEQTCAYFYSVVRVADSGDLSKCCWL